MSSVEKGIHILLLKNRRETSQTRGRLDFGEIKKPVSLVGSALCEPLFDGFVVVLHPGDACSDFLRSYSHFASGAAG